MSKKVRSEEQKARRAYVDKCKKDGVKPMPVDMWKEKNAKKEEKELKKIRKENKKNKCLHTNCKKCAKRCSPEERLLNKTGITKNTPKKIRRPIEVAVRPGDVVVFKGFEPDRMLKFAQGIIGLVLGSKDRL